MFWTVKLFITVSVAPKLEESSEFSAFDNKIKYDFQYRKLKKNFCNFYTMFSDCFGHFMTAFVATKLEESSELSTLSKL